MSGRCWLCDMESEDCEDDADDEDEAEADADGLGDPNASWLLLLLVVPVMLDVAFCVRYTVRNCNRL
jgi:hypothetical protein